MRMGMQAESLGHQESQTSGIIFVAWESANACEEAEGALSADEDKDEEADLGDQEPP